MAGQALVDGPEKLPFSSVSHNEVPGVTSNKTGLRAPTQVSPPNLGKFTLWDVVENTGVVGTIQAAPRIFP